MLLSAAAENSRALPKVRPPRRRPWKIARETVSLDRLSRGRLVFGVGTGSSGGSQVEWNERPNPDLFGGAWKGTWPVRAMRQHILQGPPLAPRLPCCAVPREF